MRRGLLAVGAMAMLGAGVLYAAQITATTANVDAARVYPNPWRADRHNGFQIIFDSIPTSAAVKIFTLSGHHIRTLSADGNGKAVWDRKNDDGQLVASGVYLYVVADAAGRQSLGKLAIIR